MEVGVGMHDKDTGVIFKAVGDGTYQDIKIPGCGMSTASRVCCRVILLSLLSFPIHWHGILSWSGLCTSKRD